MQRSVLDTRSDQKLASALASYSGVPAAFLTDAAVAQAMAPTIRLMKVMQDQKLRRIALRAHHLDSSDRDRVADLVNRLAGHQDEEDEIDF